MNAPSKKTATVNPNPAVKKSVSLKQSTVDAAEKRAAEQARTLSSYIASLILRDTRKH